MTSQLFSNDNKAAYSNKHPLFVKIDELHLNVRKTRETISDFREEKPQNCLLTSWKNLTHTKKWLYSLVLRLQWIISTVQGIVAALLSNYETSTHET